MHLLYAKCAIVRQWLACMQPQTQRYAAKELQQHLSDVDAGPAQLALHLLSQQHSTAAQHFQQVWVLQDPLL